MKLSPLALGLAAAFAGSAAWSQSSVQMFGTLDVNYSHLSSDGSGSVNQLGTDGIRSSRLGFRGTEDLGGGLKAGFWLEGAINPDDGTGGAAGGFNFARRSTVSLLGQWGEVRLGRDYVPGFWNLSKYSAFGTNGVGASSFLFYPAEARGTHVRANNTVGYHLPKLGGVFGQVMYAMGEKSGTSDGRVVGARIGYESGPFSVAFGTTKTQISSVVDLTQTNIGGSYDFGVVEVMALWGENKTGNNKTRAQSIGAQMPVGAGLVRVSLGSVKARGVANDANHFALGYEHNLSKRTALYANYGRIANKDNGKAYNVGLGVTALGGVSTGYEFGIRHNF